MDTMSARRLRRLADLIAEGSSFAAAVETLAPVPRTEIVLLRRTSFVRVFDRDLFDAVLSTRSLSFDDLIRIPGIDRTTQEGRYRVKDSLAAEHLSNWVAENPQEIRVFAAEVYQYVSGRTGYEEIEVLRFRIPVEPAEALAEFERLFTAADGSFDLGRCHALVQMLRDLDNFQVGRWSAPLRLLSSELRSRCDDANSYVAARGRFIEEFAKSASYLQRDKLHRRAVDFLQLSGDWLLPIFGAGGSGKTIFLQWLIARYCVPDPQRIPVAKLDFDDINVAKLARFPYLLLLRLAEQLDRQILGAPFSDLLHRYGKFAAILLPSARIPPGLSVDGLESELLSAPGLASELKETFAMKIFGRRVLAILDTVEEGVLHFPDSLHAALSTVREIHAQSRDFKAIVSGRYELGNRGFLEKNDPPPLEIEPFDDSEAERYLLAARRLERRNLIPAIINKAGGNPFILSLIADLVAQGEVQSVPEVEALKPENAYLIRRIIDRIPDSQFGVKWVVRYGVIPRRLTLDFLQNVMEPALREELAVKGGRFDKLKQYETSFPRTGPVEVDKLWSELSLYAAPNGWLRATSDELRFQPEVVKPMRALLAEEEIHDVLHQRARAWYERKANAEADPNRWAEWMAEALYHQFWLQSADALDAWRECLNDSRSESGKARRTLLEVVTGFVEAERDDSTPEIDLRVLAVLPAGAVGWALLEWAKSAAGIGFGPCRLEESVATIRRKLRLARTFFADYEWPAGLENLIEMVLAIEHRDYEPARALGQAVSQSLGLYGGEEELYAYSLLMARALAGLGDEKAESQYDAAYGILRRSGSQKHDSFAILAECARHLAKLGRLDRALANYQQVLEEAGTGSEIALEAAELYLQAGSHSEALRLVATGSPTLRRVRIRVLASVALGRLLQATEAWAAVATPYDATSPQALETSGVLAAAWYDLNHAVEDLDQAVTQYRRAGDAAGAEAVLLRLVRMLKDQSGHWRRAERFLTRASAESPALALERAHLQTLKGRRSKAVPDSEAGRLFQALEKDQPPRPALRQFAAELEQVQPASARYERLRVFQFLAPIDGVADLDECFFAAVPLPQPESPDFFARVFDYLELLRCLRSPAAVKLLAQTAEHQTLDHFVVHRIIQAGAKLGAALPTTARMDDFLRSNDGNALGAVTAVEYVSALIDQGDLRAAERFVGVDFELRAELHGTVIEARHLVNRARLLSEGYPERETLLAAARDIFEALGQEAPARRLQAQSQAGEDRVVVTVRTLPDPWHAVPDRQPVSFAHVRELSRPPSEVVRALRSALPDNAGLKPVIELDVDDAPLVALPWEWAFAADAVCYRSSNFLSPILIQSDPFRLLWPKLPARLRRFLSAAFPVRVAILKQPISHQERLQRGFDLLSRRPLSAIYKAHGARCFEPEQLATEAIAKTFSEDMPRVIHIQAQVIEEEGTLALDLPLIRQEKTRRQRFTADFLDQLFRSAVRTRYAPLLILDPPRPPDEAEVARQLLLRNRFAADFVALGKARAVLCTGLFDAARAELAAERLALGVSLTPQLQELLLICRREGNDRFSGQGTALFATKPEELLR